jgi:hypothetical protein
LEEQDYEGWVREEGGDEECFRVEVFPQEMEELAPEEG